MQRSPDVEAQSPGYQDSARDSVDKIDPDPDGSKYGDPFAPYWKLYKSEAETNDKDLVDSLKANTKSMVILNTLFSSIVASFIIEIYKTLLPGNSQQTTGSPPSIAIRINIVLFLSFLLSIMSAVSSTLIQQWCNEYLNFAHPRAGSHERGRVRTYLYQGLTHFQMRRFMYGTYVLLHTSVFLFFWAISDFFYTVNHHFGTVTRHALVVAATVYMLLSISSLILSNSPYNTPMTPPLRAGLVILRVIIRSPSIFLRWYRSQPFDLIGLEYYKGIHFDRAQFYSINAEKQAKELDFYAMKWLFKRNDLSDSDMDKFLESLPGIVSSNYHRKGQSSQYLIFDHNLKRIKKYLITYATSVELPDEGSMARVSSCVKALWLIFQYSRNRKSFVPDELEEELRFQQRYIQGLIDDFQTLCSMDNPTIALRASCTRALAIQALLSQLVPPDSRASPEYPVPLIPIYNFFFPNDNSDTIRQLDDGHTPSAMETERMWKNLLHNGSLANLTTLAQAVCYREDAPSPALSFCWKALDILLAQLGTIYSEEPTRTQSDFDNLHEKIRTYVHNGERGFRITPLLDILDTVARGRRVSMVFSGNPKYHNRADLVFGKEYLRNSDLLEAFAHCLPDFISNNSLEVCRDFMENAVLLDGLWTSLQVNLWNAQKSDSSIPDKLPVFEHCCTVLDLAFSVLEDSLKVDWRAPEFGSLIQHFESFITHYLQGAFMGRATSFRIGVIKARFCKAVLAQFSNDVQREGTVIFRSQWDAASLARVIYTLGLRDKEDPEFWNSYVDGGHIGANFMVKALEMIDILTRDGPLLIFCQLGHLIAAAVPLDQSGLQHKDIERVLELQRKVIENERLPLGHASDTVWEELGQLRIQVNDLCGKNTGKDIEILHYLLRMIEDVRNLRFSSPEGPRQSEPAEEQSLKASIAMNPTSSSGKARGFSIPFSFDSGFTATDRESGDAFGEFSADEVLDRERTIYPPGVGVVDRSIGTFPPIVHFPYMGDVRQRPSTRRTGSGSGATGPSLVTRASTSALFTSRRDGPLDVPTVLPNPAIGSPYGPSDLRDEGQSGAAPTSEEE